VHLFERIVLAGIDHVREILGLGASAAIDDHAIKSREMHLQYAVSTDLERACLAGTQAI
jgi:hypothetical protein